MFPLFWKQFFQFFFLEIVSVFVRKVLKLKFSSFFCSPIKAIFSISISTCFIFAGCASLAYNVHNNGRGLIWKTKLPKPRLAKAFVLAINLFFFLSKANAWANSFKEQKLQIQPIAHGLYLLLCTARYICKLHLEPTTPLKHDCCFPKATKTPQSNFLNYFWPKYNHQNRTNRTPKQQQIWISDGDAILLLNPKHPIFNKPSEARKTWTYNKNKKSLSSEKSYSFMKPGNQNR